MIDNHPSDSPERQALRAKHGVRAIRSEEEGCDVRQLPTGIYGFTSAPAALELPLFVKPIVRCTEVHKTGDGETHLIGYLDPAEAASIESGAGAVRANLYPEPREKATALVALPLSRLDQRHPPSRDNGNWMAVEVAPKA